MYVWTPGMLLHSLLLWAAQRVVQWHCMLILSSYIHCILDLQWTSEPLYVSEQMAEPTALSLRAYLNIAFCSSHINAVWLFGT